MFGYKYVDIGPGPNQHTWGAVLLSKVCRNFSKYSFAKLSPIISLVPYPRVYAPFASLTSR